MKPAPRMDSRDYRMFFERAPEPLLAIAEDTLRIVAANDQALSLLGSDRRETEGKSLPDIIAPNDLDRVITLLSQNSEPGDASILEIQSCFIRDSQGADREADLAVSHRVGGQILMTIHDASSRSRLHEQLRQAQKMEALGMLAGGIAHDFNNLLTIISGYSQMLMVSSQMTMERDRVAVEQVLKASERAADLTAQLLAFSRRQTLQTKALEINDVVNQTATMLRRLIGEHIELRICKAPAAGRIHADAGQIQQMLMNLAINARDAMPGGGTLLIQTRNAELDGDYIGQHLVVKPGHYVVLEVADTGTGMDEATRKRAFEPFFTTKAQGRGTGLGLATVYAIVRQCGGSIDLYSEIGHGTTFRVYLPRVQDEGTMRSSEEENAGHAERARQPEVAGGHETILLVEDEEGVREMVKVALERRGYRILTAPGGPEAIAVARLHVDDPIDLLISDMIMPHMNGRELADRMLAERPGIGLLFISGYAGNTLQTTDALDDEMAFLQKPFAPIALTTRVREILDARKSKDETETASPR